MRLEHPLEKIARLRAAIAVPTIEGFAYIELRHALEQAEQEFISHELEEYLAGHRAPRHTPRAETPLTSATLLAAVIAPVASLDSRFAPAPEYRP